jgi:hypothetical protein
MRWSASCILSVPSLCPIIVMNYSPVRRNLKWCEIDHAVLTCWCHDDTWALGFSRSHRIFPVRCSHERQSLTREKTWLSAHFGTLHIRIFLNFILSHILVRPSSLLLTKYLILPGLFVYKNNPSGNLFMFCINFRSFLLFFPIFFPTLYRRFSTPSFFSLPHENPV